MMFAIRRMIFSFASVVLSVLAVAAISACADAHASNKVDTTNKLRPFTLSSPDFKDGGALSASSEYGGGNGCNGKNIAPSFTWKNVPAQTSSLAFIMNDPDAAVAGGFHHWVVYNIPADVTSMKGNAPFTEGTTSLDTHAYFGPCPPPTGQTHHYTFTLYALSLPHIQTAGLTHDGLIQAITGHVVGATTLIGTFSRVPANS